MINKEKLDIIYENIENKLIKVKRQDDDSTIIIDFDYGNMYFRIFFWTYLEQEIKKIVINNKKIYIENYKIWFDFVNKVINFTDKERIKNSNNFIEDLWEKNKKIIQEIKNKQKIKNQEEFRQIQKCKEDCKTTIEKLDEMLEEYKNWKEEDKKETIRWENKKKNIFKFLGR